MHNFIAFPCTKIKHVKCDCCTHAASITSFFAQATLSRMRSECEREERAKDYMNPAPSGCFGLSALKPTQALMLAASQKRGRVKQESETNTNPFSTSPKHILKSTNNS